MKSTVTSAPSVSKAWSSGMEAVYAEFPKVQPVRRRAGFPFKISAELFHFGVCQAPGMARQCRMSDTSTPAPHTEEELSLPLFFFTVVVSLAGLYGLLWLCAPTGVWVAQVGTTVGR